jgi:small subunit ribosomal protein S1
VTSVDDKESYILVAIPQPNKFQQDWDQAQKLLDSKEMWEGTVTGYNKGGLIVKFGSLQAFVPTSHLASLPRDEKPVERTAGLANWVGRTLGFKVIEVDPQRRRLVLSQREAQKEFKTKLRSKIFAELAEGQVRTGVVTGLRDFGAFVDLGGADGLIHVSEISWQRVKHPSEVLKVGQTVEVEVVKIDTTSQRVGLSLKRRQADPWSLVAERLQVGQVVEGQVIRLTPFGAFVELGEGVDGLIHISRLVNQPQLTEGDNVSVRVLSIDLSRQRIGLALVDPFQEPFGDSAE